MDDYCFKNCFENFISDIINDYFLNSYYIRGDLLDVDSIYEYSLSQKYLDEVKLELYSYKFVAKTHSLAYGMKATYTFYLSFT